MSHAYAKKIYNTRRNPNNDTVSVKTWFLKDMTEALEKGTPIDIDYDSDQDDREEVSDEEDDDEEEERGPGRPTRASKKSGTKAKKDDDKAKKDDGKEDPKGRQPRTKGVRKIAVFRDKSSAIKKMTVLPTDWQFDPRINKKHLAVAGVIFAPPASDRCSGVKVIRHGNEFNRPEKKADQITPASAILADYDIQVNSHSHHHLKKYVKLNFLIKSLLNCVLKKG
jgi:hypothetical protein